jgi:succinate dehydrogenase / fumarate reductase cytochrome b subunit
MSRNASLFKSSLGKKFVMAASGVLLFLFVVGHLVGNLQIFLGPEAINRYGHFLQSNVELLWPVRIGLLVLVGLHIWSAIQLSLENKAARPISYAGAPTPPAASYASRTMLMSGLIIAAFVIYHLLHYTAQVQAINLTGKDFLTLHDEKGRHDVYAMMVLGFQQPLVSGFYVVAMALLCLHLSHGVYAMFQSLGIKVGCCPCLPKCLAKWGAILIFAGYASIPVAILAGWGGNYVNKKPTVPITAGKEAAQ